MSLMKACFTLLLFILLISHVATLHESLRIDLKCQCQMKTSLYIQQRSWHQLEFFPASNHCRTMEAIITLKDRRRICVNPTAPWFVRVMERLIFRQNKSTKEIENKNAGAT
ncbi:interleukin-8-like [Protopterus annectens]|uniref:interleukin-8-like n=1 Tax=Protopterus annectens TaxID=7888 RepID=UPI001CFC3CA4|nr:interleukin-8-like [Protopterus annectens]